MRKIENAEVEFVAREGGVEEYRLWNGMKILLLENRVAPVATFLVLYRVGSRNEAVGHTGATHLLEHMLFKGTPTFNKERGTQIAAVLQRIGADFNATTWFDRTNYFETVPSDQLELAIWLEADRMRNSLISDADRQAEMTVVRNELDRGQNEPSIVLDEAVYAAAFREHPYHHPTIGWRSDVEHVPTSRLKAFYDTFYHPNNATAILVGDFDRATALSLIAKHFGQYPPSPEPIPEVYTEEPPQEGERRVTVRRAGEVALMQIAFHTPAALGQTSVLSNEELARRAANPPMENDIFPLVVLSTALSHGVTSRLYQALIETELAIKVHTNVDQFRDPGLFNVYATVRPGVEPRAVEEAILRELDRVAREGLSAEELEKAKRQILTHLAFDRDGTFNIALQMSEAEAVADWRFYLNYPKNIERVKADDTRRVAEKYFTEDNRTVGLFIPKQGAGGSSAMIAAHEPISARPRTTMTKARSACFYDEAKAGKSRTKRFDSRADRASPIADLSASDAPRFSSRVARDVMPSGAVSLVLENRAAPVFSLVGSLRAGSYFEPRDRPGLARLTAEMLERGTRRRSKLEIANELESAGAQVSLSAGRFAISIEARALARDLALVIGALAEELREPAFPEDELEKLKQQTIAQIREQQNNTRYRAFERFTQIVYPRENPFHIPPSEELIASIASVTTEDVRRFYERQYGGRSLILAICGDLATARTQELIRGAFGDFAGPANIEIEAADPEPLAQLRREFVRVPDKANIDVVMGKHAPLRRRSPDYHAALLTNNALGQSTLSSRLGLQVRDREGLTYGIGSRFYSPGLVAGPWYIGLSVSPENLDRATASALNVLREYVAHGITPQELADEKSSAIGSFKVSLSTTAGIAEAIWEAEFYGLGLDYLDRYGDLIEAVTLDEANAAIRRYFTPDDLAIVLAGDFEREDEGN
jgi:zinc protease